MGFMSPFEDWWDEILVLELGVVETPEWGDPGLISLVLILDLVVPLDSDLTLLCVFVPSEELLEAFCCAKRSCLRNFALLFWNQTWNQALFVKARTLELMTQ